MNMKPLLLTAFAVGIGALLSASNTVAQTQSNQDEIEDTRENNTVANETNNDAESALRAKAVRIPARDLTSALRASQDGRSSRANTVQRGPNLEAMRENLKRTREADSEREAASANDNSARAVIAARPQRPRPLPGLRAMASDRMATAERAEIARVLVPLLLPADPAIRDNVKIYGMQNIYTATATLDTHSSFSMSGTCNRVIGGDPKTAAFRKRLSANPKRLPNTGDEYHISRNDFGVDLSFSKFGCGYVITIECNDPGSDARCAGDDYVTKLAQSLLLANPELAGGE